MKSRSPKNAPTRNETGDNAKSEWKDQLRVNKPDWEDPPNPNTPKLETVGNHREPAWINLGEDAAEDRLTLKQEPMELIQEAAIGAPELDLKSMRPTRRTSRTQPTRPAVFAR